MNLDTPLSVSVRIYEGRSPAIVAALKLMLENHKKPDDLIEAVLAGISARYYVEARLLGHTHEQVMNDPLYVDPVYTNLRVRQALTEAQAREVCDMTSDKECGQYGKEMRGIYRAVHKSGLSHEDCLWAMQMVPQSYRYADNRRYRMRPAADRFHKLESFVGAALARLQKADEEVSVNEVWRAWVTACGEEAYDLPRPS